MQHKDQAGLQVGLTSTSISVLNLVTPFFIEGYAKLFKKVLNILDEDKSLQQRIKLAKEVVKLYPLENIP
jgi:hypothetical protein